MLGDWDIDAVVHFAARSLVGESMGEPSLYWRNNVVGTVALLDSLRAHGVGRIVFSSSAATYGQPAEQPIRESAPTRPTSTYGATKLAIDLALTDYARAYGLAATSLRYFNVAGALHQPDGRSYGERHAVETHLVPNALRGRDGRGRAAVAVRHRLPDAGRHVRARLHPRHRSRRRPPGGARRSPTAGVHHIVNLGTGSGSSVREVLDTVADVTGREVAVKEAPRRAGDPPVLVAANEYAASLLGWHPARDLRSMVADAWTFRQGEQATRAAGPDGR